MATRTLYNGEEVYEVPENATGRDIRRLMDIPGDRNIVAQYPGNRGYYIVKENKPLPDDAKNAQIQTLPKYEFGYKNN